MGKTITELQAELSFKDKSLKRIKERTSSLYKEVLESRKYKNMLISQYERIVKEYKKLIQEYKENIKKMFVVYLYRKFIKKEV
jgi:hypothetical protein